MTEPEHILDLHGLTRAECKEVLDEICIMPSWKHIRLIVGKGVNSEFLPVLPSFVRSYLREKQIRYTEGEGTIDIFFSNLN